MNKRLVVAPFHDMPSPSKYCKARYPRFTAWLGRGVNNDGNTNIYQLWTRNISSNSFIEDLGKYFNDISVCEPGKELIERFPVEFRPSALQVVLSFGDAAASNLLGSGTDITMVPIVSTERGWKWNRRQLISYITKHPREINEGILGQTGCNLLTGDQQMMRRIFGKHLPAVIREINMINRKLYAGKYPAYTVVNTTPKRQTTTLNTALQRALSTVSNKNIIDFLDTLLES